MQTPITVLILFSLLFSLSTKGQTVYSDSLLTQYLPKYLEEHFNRSFVKNNNAFFTIDSNVRPFLECDGKAMTIDYSLCRYECYTIGKWTVKVLSSYSVIHKKFCI